MRKMYLARGYVDKLGVQHPTTTETLVVCGCGSERYLKWAWSHGWDLDEDVCAKCQGKKEVLVSSED